MSGYNSETQSSAGPYQVVGASDPCRPAHDLHRSISMATIFPDHDAEAASHWLVRLKDPARPSWTQRRRKFRTLRLHFHVNGYSAIGLQRRPILAEQITRSESRYSSKDHHMSHITARPWLISVTESIVLPPRPWAVKCQISTNSAFASGSCLRYCCRSFL